MLTVAFCNCCFSGFRVIAISILPIHKSTLVYGTNDGGQTMHASSDEMNRMMKRTAEILNLKEHQAGLYPEKRKLLYSAADIEGHRGTVRTFVTAITILYNRISNLF